MAAPVNLVLLASDPLWSSLGSLIYWHRHAGGVRRLCICHGDDASVSPEREMRFARFAREECPDIKIDVRHGGGEPGRVRGQLAAWHRQAPSESWVIQLNECFPSINWAVAEWIGQGGSRVVFREPQGVWSELVRDDQGKIQAQPLPEFRRQLTDDIPIDHLITLDGFAGGDSMKFISQQALALPMVRLTEGAIANGWQWRSAFAAAGVDASSESDDSLFEKYVSGLLVALGLKNVVRGLRIRGGENGETRESEIWVNHGGRLFALNAALDDSDAEPSSAQQGLIGQIRRAAVNQQCHRRLNGEWVLIRPAQRFTPEAEDLSEALNIRFLDESSGGELPGKLAEIFDLPLSNEGAEVERCLRSSLAKSGKIRAFADEPQALKSQLKAGPDPAIVRVDGLLEQVQQQRRQNWLIWTHRGRTFLRLPVSGAPNAIADWIWMLSSITGLPREVIQSSKDTERLMTFVAEFPDDTTAEGRLNDWLRPFLNGPVSFHAAQERFAAAARVSSEAAAMPAQTPPAPVRPAAPQPAETPRTDRRSAGRHARRQDPLADLDQALDAAITKRADSMPGKGSNP